MKKALTLILTVMILSGFCSCSLLSKPSDEEIKAVVEGLLPDAYTVAYIIYGPGLKLDEEALRQFEAENETQHFQHEHYVRVDRTQPYSTEREIRSLTRKVFSKDYADEILAYAFENNDEFMSRYAEYGDVLSMEIVRHEVFPLVKEFYTDTLRVVKGNSHACEAEVEALLATDEKKFLTLQLVKEEEKWLFDGAAY